MPIVSWLQDYSYFFPSLVKDLQWSNFISCGGWSRGPEMKTGRILTSNDVIGINYRRTDLYKCVSSWSSNSRQGVFFPPKNVYSQTSAKWKMWIILRKSTSQPPPLPLQDQSLDWSESRCTVSRQYISCDCISVAFHSQVIFQFSSTNQGSSF